MPRRSWRFALVAASLLLGWAGTGRAAAAIYRCGPGQYSERPCDGGARYTPSQPVRQPTAEEYKAALEVAQREKQLARDLQADRRQREQESARRGAASLSPEAHGRQEGAAGSGKKQKKAPRRSGGQAKDQRPEDFKAVSPR